MWLSGLGVILQSRRSLVRFPVRTHAWVVDQIPSCAHVRGKQSIFLSHTDVSPLLFLQPFPSKINKLVLGWGFKKKKIFLSFLITDSIPFAFFMAPMKIYSCVFVGLFIKSLSPQPECPLHEGGVPRHHHYGHSAGPFTQQPLHKYFFNCWVHETEQKCF